jgi:very-short-patch-repair endonuclease
VGIGKVWDRSMSDIEDTYAFQLRAAGLPMPEREYRIIPGRRFRADFAWPERRLMAEIEGGVFSRGRHTRPIGYTQDCEKYTLAALEGWKVLRFTSGHVESGWALEKTEQALKG